MRRLNFSNSKKYSIPRFTSIAENENKLLETTLDLPPLTKINESSLFSEQSRKCKPFEPKNK